MLVTRVLVSPSYQAESCKKKISPKEEVSLSIMELSGTVVKQGYLAKQEENRPVGGFSLRGSLVSALEDNGVPTGKGQLWPHPHLRVLPPALSVMLC